MKIPDEEDPDSPVGSSSTPTMCPSLSALRPLPWGEKSLSSTQQVSAAASNDVVRPRLAT